jgi:hypothetical protein
MTALLQAVLGVAVAKLSHCTGMKRQKQQGRGREPRGLAEWEWPQKLALAGLVALLHLVDDEDAALAAHQLIGAMAAQQGLEGVADFHFRSSAKLRQAGMNAQRLV